MAERICTIFGAILHDDFCKFYALQKERPSLSSDEVLLSFQNSSQKMWMSVLFFVCFLFCFVFRIFV